MASEIGKIVHCKICGTPIVAKGTAFSARYATTRIAVTRRSAAMPEPKYSVNK